MADGYFDRMLGDNAGAGTIGDPWRTVAKYEAQAWAAGDVAYFMRGQRWQDTPTVPTSGSGTGSSNVFVSAYGDEADPLPIFSGADLCGGWIHRAEVGPEILTDPSFEAWTGASDLTHYTEAVAGGDINQEATEVMDGASAVEMIRNTSGYFGIYQEPHTLAWDKSYIFSCHHMETAATVGPGVMISRGPVGSGAHYLQANGSWSASIYVHYFTQSIDCYSWFDLEFDTGADDASGWEDEYRIEWTSYSLSGYGEEFYLDKASLRELVLPENQLQNHEWENWTGTYPTETPDIWSVTENGTSEVTKESSEVFKGTYSCKIHIDGSNSDAGVDQDLKVDLPWNTKFRISVWHKEVLGATATGAGLQVAIGRGLPTGQYLQADGTWDSPVVLHALCTDQYNPDWTEHHLDFDTGAAGANPDDYNLQITPYSVGTIGINSDHYIGPVRIGRIKQHTPNLLPDPGLDSWPDGVINNFNWAPIETANTQVTLSKQAWYGKTAADLYTWDDEDVGIKAEWITFEPSTEYRFQVHHQEYVQDGYADVKIALRVQRHMASAPDQYWDPSTGTWEETIQEAWTGTSWDWGLGFVNFETPSGASDQLYTLWIHRNSGTCPKRFHIQIDEPAVVKVVAEEIYVCDFEWAESTPTNYDSPIHCYVTGSLRGIPVDSFQLMLEDPFTAHPRLWCWSYDAARRLCYLNIGEDPGDLEVELSVRDYNFEFNQQSHVTLQHVNLEKAVRANADLPHAAISGARKEDLTVEHCKIRFAGEAAVKAGFMPVLPEWGYSGADPDPEIGYCPADLTFRDNEISYWNRNRNTHIKEAASSWAASWGPFDCGILVAYGKDADESRGDEIGTVLVQRNRLESDRFLFNGNSGVNGIYVMLGDDITIEDNYVTGSDHALIAMGAYKAPGDARTVTIRRNTTWETGDDGCWLYGLTMQPRVCFNLFGKSGDNGVDCWDSVGAEIYNNTFYKNRNENVLITADVGGSYCSAFIYNNIFSHWGEWVKDAGSVNQRGCAVAFAGGYTWSRTFIDHNLLYPDPDVAGADDHAYHFDETEKTIAEVRGYGFELDSQYGSNPRFRDPDNGDLRLRHDSPAIDGGKDIREIPGARWYDAVTYTWTRFRNLDAEIEKGMLDPDSDWPTGIQTVDPTGMGETGAFDQGAFAYITHKSTYYVTDSGAGIEDLLPVVNEWRTVGGREISPVPVLYEIGGGGYAFASRPVRTMWAKVDADPTDSLTLGDLRYRTFEIKPDEGYLQRISEQIPDGPIQETVDAELSSNHGTGAWDPEFTSYWSEDMVATARIILGIPAAGTIPATPSAGALFDLAADVNAQDGVLATIRGQTDQFTFTGADVNSTLAGEEVDIGSVKGTPVVSISDFVADLTALTSLVQGCATPSDILVNSTQPIFTDSSGYVQLANAGLGGAINTATIAIQAQTDLMAFVTGDIKATLDGETVTAASVTDKTGYSLADGSFKAVTFDGSTAYPTVWPDSGTTILARGGSMAYTTTDLHALITAVGVLVTNVETVTDILALMYEYSVDHYRWNAGSLELGPTSGDWTANEKTAVMAVLGVLADTAVPVEPTSGTLKTIKDDVAGVATLCGDIAGIKTDVTSILTDTAEIAAVKTQTDKISVNVIPNQTAILADLVDIDADVTIIKNKLNLFPDDLASDTELQGYLTTLQGNITTPLALVQADTTALLADTLLLKGLTFHNTHRRARTYAGGLLMQEFWDEYDGADFGPGSGATALVIKTWKVDYVYQDSTDKVQDMYVRPG